MWQVLSPGMPCSPLSSPLGSVSVSGNLSPTARLAQRGMPVSGASPARELVPGASVSRAAAALSVIVTSSHHVLGVKGALGTGQDEAASLDLRVVRVCRAALDAVALALDPSQSAGKLRSGGIKLGEGGWLQAEGALAAVQARVLEAVWAQLQDAAAAASGGAQGGAGRQAWAAQLLRTLGPLSAQLAAQGVAAGGEGGTRAQVAAESLRVLLAGTSFLAANVSAQVCVPCVCL